MEMGERIVVTQACGHQDNHYLRNGEDAAVVVAEAAHFPCYNCRQDRKRAAAAALPALTGSEKQVAWALKIRIERLGFLAEFADDNYRNAVRLMTAQPGQEAATRAKLAVVNGAVETLRSMTSAAWWIDHRTADETTLLRLGHALSRPGV